VPAWRDKYVQYGRLKRKLEQIKGAQKDEDEDTKAFMARALSEEVEAPRLKEPLLPDDDVLQQVDAFMKEVHSELVRVSHWYEAEATNLEHRVRQATSRLESAGGAAGLQPGHSTEELEKLHLEAAQLTEYVLLNVEALRKIVKKMDKTCNTKEQKNFVEKDLKSSPFAACSKKDAPFNGERARRCRQEIEAYLSPERIQELRSKAMSGAGFGSGLSMKSFRRRRALVCIILASLSIPLLGGYFELHERARRCVALVVFTVTMWISEAAPFEATALFVPPLAVVLNLLPGSKKDQAKALISSVFTDSLYLVLCGFCISSVFTRCQLESRTAAFLQQSLGDRPFLFILAIMFLGLGLSSLLSNVTAPLLLIEVLKPLLKDAPTDSRYSRALLLGLAFSCNIGGMMTPISSPQNVASLEILKQSGGFVTWGQWLAVSVPFCSIAIVAAWALLMLVYRIDESEEEKARHQAEGCPPIKIPAVIFEREALTTYKWTSLIAACATLCAFAWKEAADFFGGTPMVAIMFVSISLGTGMITRQTFNSYSWHLLFLIGGGSALGFAVDGSGLLKIITKAAKHHLSDNPTTLVAELVLVLVGATTFVSHTVAALVLMPLVVKLGGMAGCQDMAVLVCALACSVACALPMTSFPNVNSLMAADDHGKPWLSIRHFLLAGTPMTLVLAFLLVTVGFFWATVVMGPDDTLQVADDYSS